MFLQIILFSTLLHNIHAIKCLTLFMQARQCHEQLMNIRNATKRLKSTQCKTWIIFFFFWGGLLNPVNPPRVADAFSTGERVEDSINAYSVRVG
jgi:hypothetical protein